MPHVAERIKLPQQYDRRRKLLDSQKAEIVEKYSTDLYSLQNLADEYGVSKKTILLTVNPESKKKDHENRKKKWRDYQQTGEQRNKTMRDHRHYKQKLFEDGKIK